MRIICIQLIFKNLTNRLLILKNILFQSSSILDVSDKSEGAKAMLDQDPATTPMTNAKANQYNVAPPQIKIHTKGSSVVRLV